jgi:dTMP kinase
MKRGKFIALEGGGGSGKSSCIEFLKEHLPPDDVLFTREPGGTEQGEEIRQVLLRHGRTHPSNAFEQLLGMEMSRSVHVRTVIAPALVSGRHVICDRFSASTFGYQIKAGDIDGEWLRQLFHTLENRSTRGIRPDLWIFLSLPAEIGMERRKKSSTEDIFDTAALSFQQRVASGIADFIRFFPHVVIDATPPQDVVFPQVLSKVKEVLGL